MKENYYKEILNSVDFAVAEHEMIYDNQGKAIDYRFIYVNNAFLSNLGFKEEQVIGRTVYELLPETESNWIERYNRIIESGVSSSFINYSMELDSYYSVFAYKSGEVKFITSFKDITNYIKVSSPDVKDDIIANIFEDAKTAYFEYDIKNRTFESNPVLIEIIGVEINTYDDYVNVFSRLTHPADKHRVDTSIDSILGGNVNQIAIQLRLYNKNIGDYIWISFFAYIEKTSENAPIKIKGLLKDIDTEKRKSLEHESLDLLFKETRKIANIATFYFNVSNQTFNHSKELDEFTGVKNLIHLDNMRKVIHPDDLEKYDKSTQKIEDKPDGVITNYRFYKNGEIRYIQSSIFGESDASGKVFGVFGILKDTTELERNKAEIEYFANHDVLTGLYNRNNFERVSKTLSSKENVCLLICDVDGLKLINDAFGHLEGDELLIHLADILKEVGGRENVYRIGGDEFVIIVYGADEQTPIKLEKAIKEKIKEFRMYGVGFDASIGYSLIKSNQSYEDAFRDAENLMYRRKLTERKSRKSTVLNTIMQTMHEKTEETEEHCLRVGDLATELLRSIGKKRDYEIEEIKLISDVHDIGKISISDKILTKPDILTKEEYEKIKYHSESGYKIISNIIDNEDIAIAILYHHENFDGSGYPHGLKGTDIPLYSRVISICDAYDAMTNDRVYRKAISKELALQEIIENSGTQFDPELVDKFIKIVK